jgi:hypothetical protein
VSITNRESHFTIDDVKARDLPLVMLAVVVNAPTPFLEEFFEKLKLLDYPKHRMLLWVYNSVEAHAKVRSSTMTHFHS